MVRIDAPAVFAEMVNGHSVRNLHAVVVNPRGSVTEDNVMAAVLIRPSDLRIAMGGDGVGRDEAAVRIPDATGCGPLRDPLRDDDGNPWLPSWCRIECRGFGELC